MIEIKVSSLPSALAKPQYPQLLKRSEEGSIEYAIATTDRAGTRFDGLGFGHTHSEESVSWEAAGFEPTDDIVTLKNR
jgi:hypothetical protein